jgi:AraC-like DNA-binding protein
MGSKILIVEDELIIAKDISLVLEQEGYETRIGVTTVTDAIFILNNEKFDLVLIDINLYCKPDGVELGNYLLKKDTIPFIYITSHSDNLTFDRIKESRPHGIIIKPFKPVDLKSVTAIVLNNYQHKNIDVFRKNDVIINDDVPFILRKVINFINENLHEKIELENLSKISRWSHQHFIKNFSKFVGCTPYQYILIKKIERSKTLIANTNISLSNIASDVGFQSYSNFYKAFKRHTGYSPDTFKKMSQIKNKQL